MSKEVAGAVVVIGIGGLVALTLWLRLRAKPLDRRALKMACSKLGGRLATPERGTVGFIAELPFRDNTFLGAVHFTPAMGAWISSSSVEIEVGEGLPPFSVFASSNVGDLGRLSKDRRFRRLRLEAEDRAAVRALWSESALEKMAQLVDPREIREGWLRALSGEVKCDGSKLIFGRTPAFRRPESYELVLELLAELLDAAKSSSNRSDAPAIPGQ